MKANSAHRLLPFKTFGEAAAFDLEVEVSCRCRRRVVIDGMAPAFRDRRIMGTRFRCTTILPHGVAGRRVPRVSRRPASRGSAGKPAQASWAEHGAGDGARSQWVFFICLLR